MDCALCDRPATTRGWCRLHYQRWRRLPDRADALCPECLDSLDVCAERVRAGLGL